MKLYSTEEEVIANINSKKSADPNYDPFTDQEAVLAMQNAAPDIFRESLNAVERLNVALKDTVEGKDGVSDINSIANVMPITEAISSPQSKWFKSGFPDTAAPDESELESILADLAKEFPGVKDE